ncbi:MAG: type toxin-antitoxin system RelE/ParE family toxin [Caulobacter sp.]|nr:type toxin-antitoxin system RelE/ParE family toxin [Caulobacter sp.]
MRLVFTDLALADLEEIGRYIALDNPARAASYLRELREHCLRIPDFPFAYPPRPSRGRNVRIAVHGRHVVVFAATKSKITIRRIVDGAMLK